MDLKTVFDGVFGINTPNFESTGKRIVSHDFDLEWFKYLVATKPMGSVWIRMVDGKERIMVEES